MGCSKYDTEYWRSLIEANAPDPSWVGKLLAWIDEESGGCPSGLGAYYEVGIFQLDLEDGPAWGGSLDTLHGAFSKSATSQTLVRDLTTDEETLQVTSGIAFAQHARDFALRQLSSIGQTWSDDDTWCLTKLYHGLPRLSDNYLQAANTSGSASSWSDFRDYLTGLSQADAVAVNSAVGAKYYETNPLKPAGFLRFITNAEAVGYADSPLGGGFVSTETLIVLAVLAAIAILLSQHAH